MIRHRLATETTSAVRVVGGLVPAGLLARISSGQDVEGLDPATYHLPGGETVRDDAGRSWTYLLGRWKAFREDLDALPETDRGTALTRKNWLLPLFRELGYGQLPAVGAGGLPSDDSEKHFAVSHHWEHVPVHLLGWHLDLDRRHPGVPGAADTAPQSLVQECLNRATGRLWGMASNGRVLRLLRDSTTLIGASYIEFDLESIFDGEQYADFVLLYLMAHQSRVEMPARTGMDGAESEPVPADCWLERWRVAAIDTGARALEKLRGGVAETLETLGAGFLAANPQLKERLRTGELSLEDYHRALLRTVYRLLFLFVTEDRGALLDPEAEELARERYTRYFSTGRLRELALRRVGDTKGDLWQALVLVTDGLGSERGVPELGLPPLGGLFDHGPLDILQDLALPNQVLLSAVRSLALVRDGSGRPIRIDYQHLGAEELGSVYESLLEEVPQYDPAEPDVFTLERLAGNERKKTGSYYTPTPLIDCLLDSTLAPLIRQALRESDPERALLELTVCDPACGSGHFLVASARRLAKALAYVRTGDPEPVPVAVRSAMRDVVSHCVHGVDLNPLATELAKVSLWLETLEPGRPLSFLDAQIKVGNALLGVTPRLLANGIPNEAYKPLGGDDKRVAASLRKRNAAERIGQSDLFSEASVRVENARFAKAVASVVQAPARSLVDIHVQAQRYRDLAGSPELRRAKDVADAWCAAFVWRKTADAPPGVTTAVVEQLDAAPETVDDGTREEVYRLAEEYRFFHWHLEFPHVFAVDDMDAADAHPHTGWRGGFACMVGNPPWEKVKLSEKEFFAGRHPGIANAANKAAREREIKKLEQSEAGAALHAEFVAARRRAEGESHLLRSSDRYPLAGRGDVNTYAVFAETATHAIAPKGRMGLVLPTGIATDATTAPFFSDLVRTGRLASFLDFENEAFILSRDVHHSVRFCLLSAGGQDVRVGEASFAFKTRYMNDLPSRMFAMPPEEILLVNPNTGTLPVFGSRRDAEITLGIYRRVPVLIREGDPNGNPWGVSFMTMFHMANDSGLFHTRAELEAEGWQLRGNVFERGEERMLPLLEAKMLHHFDHRYGSYEGQTQAQANMGTLPRTTAVQHDDPSFVTLPRYWVPQSEVDSRLGGRWEHQWLLGWRDIARSSDERTMIPAAFPRAGVNHKFPLALVETSPWAFYALISSFIWDYVARCKVSGTSLTYFYLKQFAAPPPANFDKPAPWDERVSLGDWMKPRVLELAYTSTDMSPFARKLGDTEAPFPWDDNRRKTLRAELDAAVFLTYGLQRDEVMYVMETFPVVKRKDVSAYDSYRTRDVILEAYDAMTNAIASGLPYAGPTPPPGHTARHEAKITT